jgi:ATP phosphoribosyltransferase
MDAIGLALSKGRILEETGPLLARVGLSPKEDPERSRKLVIPTARRDVNLIVVRAADTPTYVAPTSASPARTCSSSTAARGCTSPSIWASPGAA